MANLSNSPQGLIWTTIKGGASSWIDPKAELTRNVNNYIYHFREQKNEIPSMNLAKAYNLFMHNLNSQLCQLASALVTIGDLDELIKVVKKATMYGEGKGSSPQSKIENKQKERQGNTKGAKAGKGSYEPNEGNEPKGQVQIVTRGSTSEISFGTMLVVAGGNNTKQERRRKPQKGNVYRG